jgi:hypothetical protein
MKAASGRLSTFPQLKPDSSLTVRVGGFCGTREYTRPTTQAANILDPFFCIFYTAFLPAKVVLRT